MAIKNEDFITADKPFDEAIKNIEDFIKQAKTLNDVLSKDLKKTMNDFANNSTSTTVEKLEQMKKALADNNKEIKQATALQKELAKVQDSLTKANAEAVAIETKEYKELQKLNQENAKRKKDLQDEVKLMRVAKDSLVAKEIQLKRLREQYRGASVDMAKKMLPEIQKLDKEVKSLNADIGQHQMNVGNYADSLGVLSPQLGRASQSVLGLKTAFMSLIATPVGVVLLAIAAAVGVVVGAFKVMASTDSGGTRIAAEMEALKQKLDEMRKDLINFDFAGALSRIFWNSEAEKAAFRFAYEMDAINDRYEENASTIAELNKQIEENLYLSKDQTKTATERLVYLDEAQNKTKELLEIEKTHAKDVYDAKLRRLSIESKVEQQILDLYATGTEADRERLMKYNKNLAAYRDSNEKDLLDLINIAAEKIQVDTKYFSENKRLMSQRTAAIKEMYNEEIKIIEDTYALKISMLQVQGAKEKKIFDLEQKGKLEAIEKQYKHELISETEYQIKKNKIIVENRKFRFEQARKEREANDSFLKMREAQEQEIYKINEKSIKDAYLYFDNQTKLWEDEKEARRKIFEDLQNMSNEDWGIIEESETDWSEKFKFDADGNIIKENEKYIYDSYNQLATGLDSIMSIYESKWADLVSKFADKINEQQEIVNNEAQLMSAGLANTYAKEKEELAKLTAAKEKAMEKERRMQILMLRMNQLELISNYGMAASNIWKEQTNKPYGWIEAIAATAVMIGQIAATESKLQSLKKYKKGGLIEGASHEQGGVPLIQNGVQFAEAEGGEYIVNKAAYQNAPIFTSMINEGKITDKNLNDLKIGRTLKMAGLNENTSALNSLTKTLQQGDKIATETHFIFIKNNYIIKRRK